MRFPNLLPVPLLFAMPLSTSTSPLSNLDRNAALPTSPSQPLQLRALGFHSDTFSPSNRFTMGPFKVFILKSIAVLPITLAASEMTDFFTVVAQAGHIQKLAGRVTDHYDFGFGAIKMFLNTMPAAPNQAAPPLDWDLVMWIGSQLLAMTDLGWTDHFAAVFVDPRTKVQTFVTLQVVSAGLATIGFVNPQTGQPITPAIDYFKGNR